MKPSEIKKYLSEKDKHFNNAKYVMLCQIQEDQFDSKIYQALDSQKLLIEIYPN